MSNKCRTCHEAAYTSREASLEEVRAVITIALFSPHRPESSYSFYPYFIVLIKMYNARGYNYLDVANALGSDSSILPDMYTPSVAPAVSASSSKLDRTKLARYSSSLISSCVMPK